MRGATYFRYTPVGHLLRTLSGGRFLPHINLASQSNDELIKEPISLVSDSASKSEQDKEKALEDAYLVDWAGKDDPSNPKNFPMYAKIVIGIQIGLLTFIVTVSSSIYVGGVYGVIDQFGCSSAVAALGLSLFVIGYGVGPLLWGPLSEIPSVGRNWIYIPTLIIYVILQVPTALAHNLGTLLSMRLLGGLIGSPVLAVGAGSMVDVFEPRHLSYCLGIWGSMAALGPLLGPLMGGYAFQNLGTWRWTIWPIAWMGGFVLALLILLLPETSADKLLSDKARRLRQESGNPKWRALSEREGGITLSRAARVYLIRPFALLAYEPIVLLLSLYLALLYGLEYLFFEAFPFVFAGIYGWKPGPTGLGFFGIFVGVYAGLFFQLWFIRFRYGGLWARLGRPPPLEEWLWPMLFASFSVPIGMFWFGWTARPEIHYVVPIIGSTFFGFALYIFFQGVSTYLAFGYRKHAASVFAANDFLRCAFGAAFPLFSTAMYEKLGAGWASSVPGFISIVLIPVPFIFYKYGARIRSWSKYAD